MEKIEKNERPLVTFALLAYNQEKFIREAIEGALSQTYSPLEIIFSDDCSTDRTFEIMQEMVKDYEGPHQVILNRNEKNRGIGSHVNKLFSIANGELIVIAAGDDISLPRRSETLCNYWLRYNRPSVLQSNYIDIDTNSNHIKSGYNESSSLELIHYEEANYKNIREHVYNKKKVKLVGCSAAYSAELAKKFGPINEDILQEDVALVFRGLLSNGILRIPDVLVKYRKHENNLFNKKYYRNLTSISVTERERQMNYMRNRFILPILQSYIHDIDQAYYLSVFSQKHFNEIKKELIRRLKVTEIQRNWWQRSIIYRFSMLMKLIFRIGNHKNIKWALRRMIPLEWGEIIKRKIMSR